MERVAIARHPATRRAVTGAREGLAGSTGEVEALRLATWFQGEEQRPPNHEQASSREEVMAVA